MLFRSKGVKSTFYYKNKGNKEFTALRKTHALDESISPLVFDYDNQTLFVTSNIGRDRRAIYKFDPKTNKLGEMIFSHDTVDVSNLIMSDRQKKMLAVTYVNQYPEVKYFDKESELLMKGLTEAFVGKRVDITSRSKDEMLNIVMVHNDNDPGS